MARSLKFASLRTAQPCSLECANRRVKRKPRIAHAPHAHEHLRHARKRPVQSSSHAATLPPNAPIHPPCAANTRTFAAPHRPTLIQATHQSPTHPVCVSSRLPSIPCPAHAAPSFLLSSMKGRPCYFKPPMPPLPASHAVRAPLAPGRMAGILCAAPSHGRPTPSRPSRRRTSRLGRAALVRAAAARATKLATKLARVLLGAARSASVGAVPL